ncbi:NACHT domain-containing protein [Streptomyces sviceus]|uniref:NACHT domain-containing protein n=1 Tax=Streptomyces sviceus TaxID=285530 RepID=UPI0036B11E25
MVIVATVWVLGEGKSAVDSVTLLGFPVALASLMVAVAGIPAALSALTQTPDDAAAARAAAARLARQVHQAEQREWLRLVGGDTERINLHFTLRTDGQRRPAVTVATSGSLFDDGGASVPDIVTFYRDTRPARLVVTGSPGAGKTVLALELLLALIGSRSETDPVPIRLSLAEWDTSAMDLEGFLVRHLTQALDWPQHIATRLVQHHLVLPVLDGLDEMDPLLSRNGHPVLDRRGNPRPDPDAPRARAALNLLNIYQDGLSPAPLILTCRGAHYEALPEADRLRTAARIHIAHVTPERAITYLAQRSGDSPRWNSLLRHLDSHPAGPAAQALSTPWRLSLAATIYHRSGEPHELLAHTTPSDLDNHLLGRLIPAATELDVLARHHRRYKAEDVHRWLSALAVHLASVRPGTASEPTGAMGTDLVLHELWPMSGRRRIRAVDAVLSALTVLLTLPVAWATPNPAIFAPGIVFVSVAVGAIAALNTSPAPHRLHWGRLATSQGRVDLTLGLTAGLLAGVGLSFFADALLGIGFGLACGLIGGLVVGAIGQPVSTASPRQILRNDLTYGLMSGAAWGLATAVAAGLTLDPRTGLSCGIVGFVSGLVGLTAGITAKLFDGILPRFPTGIAAGFPATRRYLVFLLCSRNRLPFRLIIFLDWSCDVGLLRRSGPAYQFRHREIQRWLTPH